MDIKPVLEKNALFYWFCDYADGGNEIEAQIFLDMRRDT